VLSALKIDNNINRNNTLNKTAAAYLDLPWVNKNSSDLSPQNRHLQSIADASKKLYNPATCLKQGDSIFWKVDT